MASRFALTAGVVLVVICWSSAAGAAELRGRLWAAGNTAKAPADATLQVTCGGRPAAPVELAENGAYSLRNLAPNVSCQLVVTVTGNNPSRPVSVRMNATSVVFNGEVRVVNGNVILLRR